MKRLTTEEFINKSKEVHGDKYDYSRVNYINNRTKVEIICPIHDSFWQIPASHNDLGNGCPECGLIKRSDSRTLTTPEFIEKAKEIHNDNYDYSRVNYINNITKVEIICLTHNSFFQKPSNHLVGQGCNICSRGSNYSKIAIKWLNSMDGNIQHAENGGEYKIPTTNFPVDGYCKETNTVYEFHGDKFHGNPKLYSPDDTPHPFNKNITAKELYDKTIEKENIIKKLGYNLVVMWENEYLHIL